MHLSFLLITREFIWWITIQRIFGQWYDFYVSRQENSAVFFLYLAIEIQLKLTESNNYLNGTFIRMKLSKEFNESQRIFLSHLANNK